MVIDYSKWDRMDYGDDVDNDDDDEDECDDDTPQVTSLDRPGRVTIGPAGSTIEFMDDVHVDDEHNINTSKSQQHDEQGSNADTMRHYQKRSLLTRNGGMHEITIFIPNNYDIAGKERDAITIPIYWSQDRYAVTVRIGINPTIFPPRNIRFKCKGALSYADRHSAVGSGGSFGGAGECHGSIEIVCVDVGTISSREGGVGGVVSGGSGDVANKSSAEVLLLSERLYRPIYLNEGEDELDFEIEDCGSDNIGIDDNSNLHIDDDDNNDYDEHAASEEKGKEQQQQAATTVTKFVTIVLPKAVPMIGMTFWWDRLFVGYPTIDMNTIVRSERKDADDKDDGTNSQTKAGEVGKENGGEAFRKAWESAHAAFQEKMKTRERQSIDIDG